MHTPKSDFTHVETIMMQGVAFHALLESAKMGLFDTLENGPLSAGAVAKKHGFTEQATEALLDLLTGLGVAECGPCGYANTLIASEYLASSSPFCQIKTLELHNRFNSGVVNDFSSLMRGDNDMRSEVDDGWSFEDSMEGTLQHARQGGLQETLAMIASLPDLNMAGLLCDVGGNHGEFSMSLLEQFPSMTGELLDQPSVVEAVAGRIADRGLSDRLTGVGVDLRTDPLKENCYDLIVTSHILYAFIEELDSFAQMLFRSLRPGGWFVSHHLNHGGDGNPDYANAVQFVTRMAGYKTHYIAGDHLKTVLRAAGFTDIRSCPSGKHREGLLVAARKA